MDSFQFNKYAMAILGTVFIVFCLSLISEAIFHTNAPEERAFVIATDAGPSVGGAADGADSGPIYEPIGPLLVNASTEAGERVFKKCAACHTVDNGGANKVGPNLWNIVNSPIAADDDFSYSSSFKDYAEGKNWTYEELNGFLWKPRTYVRGTAMGFAGLPKVEDRANVVFYLRSISDNPAPLPDPATAAVSEEPADDAASEGAAETATDGGSDDAAAAETAPADDAGTDGSADTGTDAPASDSSTESSAEPEAPAAESEPADTMEQEPADTMEEKPAEGEQAN